MRFLSFAYIPFLQWLIHQIIKRHSFSVTASNRKIANERQIWETISQFTISEFTIEKNITDNLVAYYKKGYSTTLLIITL